MIAIGTVMGTHGVRGELRVKIFNTESDLLTSQPKLTLKQADASVVRKVRTAKRGGKGWLVQLAGVDSFEAAKALHGAEISVPRGALPRLAPGEFYYADLAGLRAQNPDGQELGRVLGVREYPAAAVLQVQVPAGTIEVPMVAPYFVSVDVDAGYVVVDHSAELEIEAPRR
ncbi:MAG TPA: ribosome maturation factor RimM [Polyangiales bacterium]